jgi:predicted transcriptional regulator
MQTMAKKKGPKGRARDRGDLVPLTFEVSPELHAALEACAQRDYRTKRAVATLALEKYLAEQGLWTLPGAKGGGE